VKRFSEENTLTNYIIVACSKCGGYLLAKESQKNRTCPYCGSKVVLEKAKKVAAAENANEASALLRKLKEKAAKGGKVKLQRRF
jgi:DNA-directed RNA polymerase subunit RPC12/RpoP